MQAIGLEDVVAAQTRLSAVMGEQGRLVIAGEDVETALAQTFEQRAYRLLETASAQGPLPFTEHEFLTRLGRARVEAAARVAGLGQALHTANAMNALRAALAQLPSAEHILDDAIAALGAAPVFVAAWWRAQHGLAALAPDPARGHAEDYLRLLGRTPSAAQVRALDTYLGVVLEHGLNASTFATRVVVSTRSDLISGLVAGVGALKGPLHGGAPGPVLDMLDAIKEPERASEWLEARLDAGERVMGMGHRVYRKRDPRAAALEQALARLLEAETDAERRQHMAAKLGLARATERAAEALLRARQPGRALHANVEFFTAVLLDAVGIDRRLFATTFAVARIAGWSAHALEQGNRGRLIRPRAEYVGLLP